MIVTRHFSRAVAGAFVTATSLFLIVEAIAGLGAGNGAVYFIARLRPASAKGRSSEEAASQQAQADLRRAGPGRRRALRACGPWGRAARAGGPRAGPLGGGRRTGRRRCRAAAGGPGRNGSSRTAQWRARTGGSRRSCGLRCGPVLVASVLSAGLMLLFAGPLARLLAGGPFARGGAAPGPAADAIRALAVAVPFAALADTFLGASRGFRNMLPTVVVDRITRPAVQVAGLIAAVAVGRAALLAPLWALPYLPASLAAWLWLRRTRLRPRPAARPAPAPRPGRGVTGHGPARPVGHARPPQLAARPPLDPVRPARNPARRSGSSADRRS